MTKSWIKMFFAKVRGIDEKITQMLADMPKAKPLTWKDTNIRDHLTEDQWKSLSKELAEHLDQRNDRAVAVSYQAMVEDRLRWLIEQKFIQELSNKEKKKLFEGGGPLSANSSKIEIAYALGLIPMHFRKELELIGRIRNKFAHRFLPIRFADPEIMQLCDLLRAFDEGEPPPSMSNDPMIRYAAHCFLAMMALFAIGQVHIRAAEMAASPEQSE